VSNEASGLERARELGGREGGLAVVVTQRRDGSPHVSVVNAGVLAHPGTREDVVGFVVRGGARKLTNLRMQPRATVVFRSGWDWIAVEGNAELAGPDDDLEGLHADEMPRLVREVYAAAAGGVPDDWHDLDEVIAAERHTVVLLRVHRVYPTTTVASDDE
jgi:PPOX class probable F420-dependent enzyme